MLQRKGIPSVLMQTCHGQRAIACYWWKLLLIKINTAFTDMQQPLLPYQCHGNFSLELDRGFSFHGLFMYLGRSVLDMWYCCVHFCSYTSCIHFRDSFFLEVVHGKPPPARYHDENHCFLQMACDSNDENWLRCVVYCDLI